MPTEIKQILGVVDLDSSNETIAQGVHRDSRNVTFRGVQPNVRVENIKGNRLLDNPLLPAVGQNLNLGRWYDAIKKRIYIFNYNGDGSHGVYLFNTIPQTFQRLVEVGVNTNGDVLEFNSNNFICNVNVVYGDTVQGDQLFWLNSQGKPCKINVDKALAGDYGVFETQFLDVATAPPSLAPYVVYEDDSDVVVNNVRKKLFKFKTRLVYNDNEKSVTSIQSEIPLPYDPFEPSVDADATKNCRIAIVFQTGDATVKKVELLATQTTENPADSTDVNFGDYFLIASIDKSVLGLADNDIAVFNFYNDQAYNFIDVNESIQLFDLVPLVAVAQELLNGNTLIYGNITEGYDNLTNFSNGITTSSVQYLTAQCYEGRYFSLLVTNQSGEAAFGTGRTHVVVKGRVTENNVYTIYYTDGATTITYTALAGDTLTDVLDGLIADATGNGFTIIGSSATPDALYFTKTNLVLAYSLLTPYSILENIENSADGSLMAYDWWSRYSFGLVYFDSKGRTNGAVYPATEFTGQTVAYNDSGTQAIIPELNAAIYHRPPTWAVNYSWVRTKNLSKSTFLQWVSVRTFKDTTSDPNDQLFAYVDIDNLNAFRVKNPSSPLKYDFAANDRIRFIKRFNADNSTANLYTDKDFEIQSQEIAPTINGIAYTGQFLKIFLPATDTAFDFGGSDYANYFVELYSPAQSVSNGLDLYYEFGERYTIGNPGTVTAIHQGQYQNQSTNLVAPALFIFTKGDDYTRFRKVQTGIELSYAIAASSCSDPDAGRITIGAAFVSESLTDPNITPGSSPCDNLLGFDPATDMTRYLIKIGTGTFNFRIKGAITIEFLDDFPGDSYRVYLQKSDLSEIELVPEFDNGAAGTYSFTFDTTFTMTTGERIFIIGWSVPDNDHMRVFKSTTFTITRTLAFVQTVIDPNFSDYYPSAVNSNGRGFIYDVNAAQLTYSPLMRWSLAFQESSNINQSNRFYPLNFDQIERSKGGIMRFRVFDRMLRVFQERKCGQLGIYQKFITQADGSTGLITTNDIITKNNISYYTGDFGIGNQVDSLVSSGFRDYFVDPIKGFVLRLSTDGLTVISEMYKTQTFVGNTAPKYLTYHGYPFGGTARITGVYNIRKDLTPEYLCIFQGGFNEDETLTGQTLAFNEAQKGFSGFYEFDGDSAVCAENTLYTFYGGQLYIHDNDTDYANFYGVQKEPSITFAFNDKEIIKKVYDALAYQGNVIWESPVVGDIATSMINPQTGLQQQSKLVAADYEIQENVRYCALLRDVNSMADAQVALWEGDYLTGTNLLVKFVYRGSDYAWMYLPYLNWQVSNRNL